MSEQQELLELREMKKKKAKTAFICGIVAFFVLYPAASFCSFFLAIPYIGALAYWLIWWGTTLAGIIVAANALANAKKAKGIDEQPSKVFRLLGTIFGAIGLAFCILRIILRICFTILLIVLLVVAIIVLIIFVAMAVFSSAGPLAEYFAQFAEMGSEYIAVLL